MVYNPQAGGLRGRKAGRLARGKEYFRGADVISAPTTGPRTAGDVAKRCIAEGADLVVAAGGDGTINEVLEGMIHSPVPLAILPGGTANVLANEMGLSSKIDKAAKALLNCSPRRVSVGRVERNTEPARHFLLMAGVGLDAHIIYDLNLPLKARLGKIAYWIGGFSRFGRNLEEFQVSVDERAHACTFALITKVRNYGGDFEIAKTVSLMDDEFEVVLFKGHSMRYARYLLGMIAGRISGMRGVEVFRAKRVTISPGHDSHARRVHLQVDGESAGCVPAVVTVVPDALTLLIPPGYP
ncbi:MAG: YegS/Rv2252/BmrU family lipid kinase, partial [Acidobacteriota bacterium]|nr:YegS/Rv2252/BmrU family lipid kinase [Acidobacteriota bacterium]